MPRVIRPAAHFNGRPENRARKSIMKKTKIVLSHLFLWGGILLTALSLVSLLHEGADGGGGTVAIAGSVFAAAGLLALND